MTTHPNEHDLFSDHGQKDPAPHAEMLNARRTALSLLESVLSGKQALDHVLERDAAFKALPLRDKAFCRMLTATTLRRLGQIDDLITQAEDKPASKPPVLQNILRIGVAQILFMAIADHAAVDTCVKLTEAYKFDRMKGFVNAVLRNITRNGRSLLERQDEARLNTPDWLLKIWIEDYGLRMAAEIARANLSEAPLDISIKDESERTYWTSHLKATQIGAGTLRCSAGGAVTERPGFENGLWWVQDASAAIPAHLFGDVKDQTVIDLCAAPGGKTAQLAAMGAHVIALDRSAQRLQRLEENMERLRLKQQVKIVIADASEWKPQEPANFILLDAPCSATGTIRRHPDVPHLKSAQDMGRLVNIQTRILESAFQMLNPGGILVYCTCSLQKSEGEDQIQALFERHENAMKLPIEAKEIGGIEEAVTDHGDLRILPYHRAALGGMDGFFVSRITKTA